MIIVLFITNVILSKSGAQDLFYYNRHYPNNDDISYFLGVQQEAKSNRTLEQFLKIAEVTRAEGDGKYDEILLNEVVLGDII